MTDDSRAHTIAPLRLVIVPVLITLGVTLLRLIGERNHWSHALFNPEAGGGFAPVGIVWLAPIFGVYFALRLAVSGAGPDRPARMIGLYLLVFLFMVAIVSVTMTATEQPLVRITVFSLAALIALVLAYRVWPPLGRLLIAYALGARIPVAIICLVAILQDWQTHYDAPPPNFPEMSLWARYLWTGLLPQVTGWITTTLVFGGFAGAIAATVARRRRPVDSAVVDSPGLRA